MKITFTLLMTLMLPVSASECVILLHGLARSDSSMSKLENTLRKESYIAVNHGYPSTKKNIESLAKEEIPKAITGCGKAEKINFVTHSMGGILVRQYLSQNTVPSLKHVVMLGPPNKGSQVVDTLGRLPGFKLINGPAGLQLGTGELSVPNKLGPADFSLGVIAGTRSINLILSTMIPGVDDGKVSVESTKLDGMADHKSMAVTHPFMMRNDNVIKHVTHFLKHGKFQDGQSSELTNLKATQSVPEEQADGLLIDRLK